MTLVASTYWGGFPFNFKREPDGASVRHLQIATADHRFVTGLWWTHAERPPPTTAAVLMHPRVDFSRHYVIPRLIEAGYGVLAANSRTPNNDLTTVHEEIILDLGGCIDVLKSRHGVERVVLVGNSGGGSLSALYQSQATRAPAERIAVTPGGRATALPTVEMEPADALVLISCHKGQGMVMNECIDPAVVDESDPHRSDPELDMYATANGFRPPPEWCEYEAEFVTRYRAAQLARVQRLDERARELIADGSRASAVLADPEFAAASFDQEHALRRREAHEPIMTIYRTMANLHYVDRHLDPSARDYGSLLSDRPDLMNQQILGFGRLCTPMRGCPRGRVCPPTPICWPRCRRSGCRPSW